MDKDGDCSSSDYEADKKGKDSKFDSCVGNDNDDEWEDIEEEGKKEGPKLGQGLVEAVEALQHKHRRSRANNNAASFHPFASSDNDDDDEWEDTEEEEEEEEGPKLARGLMEAVDALQQKHRRSRANSNAASFHPSASSGNDDKREDMDNGSFGKHNNSNTEEKNEKEDEGRPKLGQGLVEALEALQQEHRRSRAGSNTSFSRTTTTSSSYSHTSSPSSFTTTTPPSERGPLDELHHNHDHVHGDEPPFAQALARRLSKALAPLISEAARGERQREF